MAVIAITCPVRLRNQRIEAEQETHPENRERVERAASNSDRTDCARAEIPDHNGVHNVHRTPSELSQGDRDRNGQNVANVGNKARASLGRKRMVRFRNSVTPKEESA